MIKLKSEIYQIGILTNNKRSAEVIKTGKILHLDGDPRYSKKSYMYYKKLGLNAVVKNISEARQPREVYRLLTLYNPDILIITGHDSMLKKDRDYYNIYNLSKEISEIIKNTFNCKLIQTEEREKDYFE